MDRRTNRVVLTFAWMSIVCFSNLVLGQAPPSSAEGREAMKKLSKLVGRWEGEATIQLGPGQAHKVKQIEHVQSKMDGSLLLIEGTGREKSTDGQEKVVFQALAVCNFDPIEKAYKFHAFRDNGLSTVAKTELTDNGIIWGFEDGRGGKIRYTITLSNDTWTEIGEYLIEGQPARKFFDMTVKRVADSSK
ncbi:MAG: hypothetical protein ABL921_23280 [Pirellula sp.]